MPEERTLTAEEEILLKGLWERGVAVHRIAEQFGMSRSTLTTKAHRMGLRNRSGKEATRRDTWGGKRADPTLGKKKCLCCGVSFRPWGRMNFVCEPCKATREWRSGGEVRA